MSTSHQSQHVVAIHDYLKSEPIVVRVTSDDYISAAKHALVRYVNDTYHQQLKETDIRWGWKAWCLHQAIVKYPD